MANLKEFKVLILDDLIWRHEAFRRSIPIDIEVTHAYSVAEAIQALKRDTFDLILLDDNLGVTGTGEDVARYITERPKKHGTVIVHSHNVAAGPRMAKTLRDAGYNSEYIPFVDLVRQFQKRATCPT